MTEHFPQFERGTISYMITSTITRPTAITPTWTCDRKVYLVETVDVAPVSQRKQRMITLNPISREKKVKPKDLKQRSTRPPSTLSRNTPTASAESVPRGDAQSPERPVHSPAPSQTSIPSAVSSGTRNSRIGPRSASARDSDSQSMTTSHPDKTITATIELVRAGCLPGDILPVKISINHTKPIKSLEGIIVTLYRQGRIDTHPTTSIDPTGKGKGVVRSSHDCYPKSKSGFAGLSLSSAVSSGVFRKDLSQTFAPLIVDPRSLTAVVKTSVRVPEDAFPTISSVPGAMVSFKYYVEVIVDLRGKLQAGLDSLLPRLSRPSILHGSQNTSHTLQRDENGAREIVSTFSGSILDTDQIRRERSVAACLFEVIVGTRDSGRKRVTPRPRTQSEKYHEDSIAPESTEVRLLDNLEDYPARGLQDGPHPIPVGTGTGHLRGTSPPHLVLLSPAEAVPPPVLENEEAMDEKTRIRIAEERLLPSQPPEEEVSVGIEHKPTAPGNPSNLGMDYTIAIGDYGHASTSTHARGELSAPSAGSNVSPSETGYLRPSGSSPGEDKQELERRRLQLEASAPEDFPDHDEWGIREATRAPDLTPFEPSAPLLPEDEEYNQQSPSYRYQDPGSGPNSTTRESLPRYER